MVGEGAGFAVEFLPELFFEDGVAGAEDEGVEGGGVGGGSFGGESAGEDAVGFNVNEDALGGWVGGTVVEVCGAIWLTAEGREAAVAEGGGSVEEAEAYTESMLFLGQLAGLPALLVDGQDGLPVLCLRCNFGLEARGGVEDGFDAGVEALDLPALANSGNILLAWLGEARVFDAVSAEGA